MPRVHQALSPVTRNRLWGNLAMRRPAKLASIMDLFKNMAHAFTTTLFAITFVFVLAASAAPIPLLSSSTFRDITNGAFFSKSGYSIHAGQSGWTTTLSPTKNPFIETVFLSDNDVNIQASLTVRLDEMGKKRSLDQYAKRWLKDYPRFGFNILESKKVKVGMNTGYLLELVNRDSSKQLRQVLFVKDKVAVTLTCRDDVKSFLQSLKSCNEIIRTFRWL